MNTKTTGNGRSKASGQKPVPGYPLYPPTEDIYAREKKEEDLNVDDGSAIKAEAFADLPGEPERMNEKDFEDDLSGDDLDVPGAELDDESESTGNEDEENNLYSLGGDNHPD